MTEDPIRALVAGLVSQRQDRDVRLRALADQLLGRVSAPAAAPAVPLPPPLPAEDPAAPFREALLALRAERDVLQQKNRELFDEVRRLQATAQALPMAEAIQASRHRDFLEFLIRELTRPPGQ